MEDNPIYGNIRYMQTSKCFVNVYMAQCLFSVFAYSVMYFSTGLTLLTEGDPPHSRNQPGVNPDSQVDFF